MYKVFYIVDYRGNYYDKHSGEFRGFNYCTKYTSEDAAEDDVQDALSHTTVKTVSIKKGYELLRRSN